MNIGITKEQAIKQTMAILTQIKGVGEKSAKAMITHLLSMGSEKIDLFKRCIEDLSFFTSECSECHNFALPGELCEICSNPNRDFTTVMFVKTYEDIEAFEKTGTYKGVYHVLKGLIDPTEENSNLHNLTYETFITRFTNNPGIKTIILGFDGDLDTMYTKSWLQTYLNSLTKTLGRTIKIYSLGYGIPLDMEISKADEITLQTALENKKEVVN